MYALKGEDLLLCPVTGLMFAFRAVYYLPLNREGFLFSRLRLIPLWVPAGVNLERPCDFLRRPDRCSYLNLMTQPLCLTLPLFCCGSCSGPSYSTQAWASAADLLPHWFKWVWKCGSTFALTPYVSFGFPDAWMNVTHCASLQSPSTAAHSRTFIPRRHFSTFYFTL